MNTNEDAEENGWPSFPNLPDALNKALGDEFDYALGLSNGQVIEFASADYSEGSEWIYLHTHTQGGGWNHEPPIAGVGMVCDRGIWVRISAIVWCADAPHSS